MNSIKTINNIETFLGEIKDYVLVHDVTSVAKLIKTLGGNTLLYSYLTKTYVLQKDKGVYVWNNELKTIREHSVDIHIYIKGYSKRRHALYIAKHGKSRTHKSK